LSISIIRRPATAAAFGSSYFSNNDRPVRGDYDGDRKRASLFGDQATKLSMFEVRMVV